MRLPRCLLSKSENKENGKSASLEWFQGSGLLRRDKMMDSVVLCGANSYEQKYYFNQEFSSLPQSIQDELHIMCVLYTEDVGGILTMEFDDSGSLEFKVTAPEEDYLVDEIGSVLKIQQSQDEKGELLESLELYFRTFFLGEEIEPEEGAGLEEDGG